MIGRLSDTNDIRAAAREAMVGATAQWHAGPVAIVGHFDADGLASIAILARSRRAGAAPCRW